MLCLLQIECHHSYDKKCHVTYVTDYQPQQEEDCDTNYKKDCYIEYNTMAFDTPVTICNQKMVRNCDKQGKSTLALNHGINEGKAVQNTCTGWG